MDVKWADVKKKKDTPFDGQYLKRLALSAENYSFPVRAYNRLCIRKSASDNGSLVNFLTF